MSGRGRGLAVLTYHGIGTRRSVLTTDPGWFTATLDRLDAAGFRPVDLAGWLARGRPDEPRGYALAFDDGRASIADVAPLLADRGIPATVFVVPGRVGTDSAWPDDPGGLAVERLLDWSELTALARQGITLAAHGWTHRALTSCSPVEMERELRGTREAIEDRTGQRCPLLAYPYGRSNPAVRRAAARWYDAAFGTSLSYTEVHQELHNLARIDAFYLDGPAPLEYLTADRWRPWLKRRRALRAARSTVSRFATVLRPGRERRAS